MMNVALRGKPYEGNPHVRIDEGEAASEKPRRGFPLYKVDLKVVAMAVALSSGFVVHAAAVLVGDGDRTTLEVGSGVRVEQSDPVVVKPGATFDKSGEGTWCVPLETIRETDEFVVNVRGGTLEVPVSTGNIPCFTSAPGFIRSRANIWLDAGHNVVTNTTGVLGWLDVRETKQEKPFVYPRLRTKTDFTNILPQVSEVDGGRPAIYFGGYKSGQWMAFLATNSSDTANATLMKDFRHVFIVHCIETTQGYMLGCQNNVSPIGGIIFHPGDSDARINRPIIGESGAALQCRFERNGSSIDPSSSTAITGVQLYDWHFVGGVNDPYGAFGGLAAFSALFNGMYENRQGGDKICEIIAFKDWLTEAQRLEVAGYLMDKWGIGSSVGEKVVHVADGATLKAPVQAVQITGEGTFEPNVSTGAVGYFPSDALSNFHGTVSLPYAKKFVSLESFCVSLAGGDRLVATNGLDGIELTRFADQAIGTVVKEGSAVATVHSLPDGVETVIVKGGTLSLACPSRSDSMVGGTVTNVAIGNADFETGGGADYIASCFSEGASTYTSKTVGGWKGELPERPQGGFANSWCKLFDSADSAIYSFSKGRNYTPNGKWAFGMRNPSYIYRSVTVDIGGVYDCNFLYCDASGVTNNTTHLVFTVQLGDANGQNMKKLASVTANEAMGYFRYHFQTPYLAAGTYRLKIGADPASGFDAKYASVDDIHLDLVTRPSTGWAVPNGDMEDIVATNRRITVSAPAVAKGWTYRQVPWGNDKTINGAAIIRHGASILATSKPVGTLSDMHHGCMQLMIVGQDDGEGSAATVAFKPVRPGVYRLKVDLGKVSVGTANGMSTESSPRLTAKLTIGTEAVRKIGSIVSAGRRMRSYVFASDVVFVDTNEMVRIELVNSQKNSIALVDNLEFVPAAECREGDSILKGTAEAANWQFVSRAAADPLDRSYAGQVTDIGDHSTLYFGWATYRGLSCGLRLTDLGGAYQAVTFPCPGRYMLRFHARARADVRNDEYIRNFPYGKLSGVRAVLADGAATNVLIETSTATTNFVGYTCHFDVSDSTRSYVFGFEGSNDPRVTGVKDQYVYICNPYIDLVQTEDIPTGFTLPSTLKTVEVERGAKIDLNYCGTNTVGIVKIGKRRLYGVVNAKTHPEFVTGTGALKVTTPRPGLVIVVR